VSERLGHASRAFTLDTQVLRGMQAEAAEIVDALVAEGSSPVNDSEKSRAHQAALRTL
jgi:hypothetical protein